jgi:hypothetical protein
MWHHPRFLKVAAANFIAICGLFSMLFGCDVKAQPPKPPRCWDILPYVWIYGKERALEFELPKLYSHKQIKIAKFHCMMKGEINNG